MNRICTLLVPLVIGASVMLVGCSYHMPPERERGVQAPDRDQTPPRPRSFSDPGPNYPDTGR